MDECASAPAMTVRGGGSLETERFDVPTGTTKYFVPRRRERSDIGGMCTSHKANARLFRQAQCIQNPRRRAGLECRHGGRHDVQRGILVPRRNEPISGYRHWIAATRHEPEIAWPGVGSQARLEPRAQVADDGERVL